MTRLVQDETLGGSLFDRIQGFVEEGEGPDYRDILEALLCEVLTEADVGRVEVGLVRRGLLRRDESRDAPYSGGQLDSTTPSQLDEEEEVVDEPDQDTGCDFLVTFDACFDDDEDKDPAEWEDYAEITRDGVSFAEVEPDVYRAVYGSKFTTIPDTLYYCDNRFCDHFRKDDDAFEVRGFSERRKSCGTSDSYVFNGDAQTVSCAGCGHIAKTNSAVMAARTKRKPVDPVMYCENLGCEYYMRWDGSFSLEVGKVMRVGAGLIGDSSDVKVEVGASEGFVRAKCCHCGQHTMSKIVREIAQKQGGLQ